MRKYWAFFKTNFQNALVYRADFFLWGFNDFLDTVVFLFIWLIIFGERQAIAGFTLAETITYLIGVGMIANLTSTWISWALERNIQEGSLSSILLKPVNYPLLRMVGDLSEKPINNLVRLAVYLLMALIFRDRFVVNTQPISWLLLFVSLIFAFAINYLISFCFGCLAFWTTASNRGVFGLLRTVSAIFSGGYAPIAFFPLWFQKIASFLPFIQTRYFPMLIYLDKVSIFEAVKGIGWQLFWTVALFLAARTIWRKGIKRYEGVGI